MRDTDYLSLVQPFIDDAREILRTSLKTRFVLGASIFQEYDDEYHHNLEYTVRYDGDHTEDELDLIPAARRIERRAEELLSKIPLHVDGSDGYQEKLILAVNRLQVILTIGVLGPDYERQISWTHLDPDNIQKFVIAPVSKLESLTGHEKVEILRNPQAFLEKLLVPQDHIDLLKTKKADRLEDGRYEIELDPSVEVLSLGPIYSGF